MYFDEDEEIDDKCIYTAKYGKVLATAVHFDDHCLLGAYYFQYKPEISFVKCIPKIFFFLMSS